MTESVERKFSSIGS